MASGEDFDTSKRWLQISKFGSQQFLLESFKGTERVSEPFALQLELFATETDVDATNVVGKTAGITLKLPDDSTKLYHGLVRDFERAEYFDIDQPMRRYRMTLVPWLWTLGLRSGSRVFQEQTAPQVIEQVFKNAGQNDYKLSLKGTYAKLDYCVQYRETDLEFVTRLLRDNGIFYYFTHEESKHTLVLADAASGYVDCADTNSSFATHQGRESWDMVTSWNNASAATTAKATLWSYNFETPADTLEASEKSKLQIGVVANSEMYDYPADYTVVADGKTAAVARIEHHEAGGTLAGGSSLRPVFQAGAKFKLANHPVDSENASYALVEVRYEAHEPTPLLPGTEEDERTYYANSFRCVPADVAYRPPYLRNKPIVHGMESAQVTGPKGSETYFDKYARVRIQFHWDREGKFDDKSSCWMRVAQPWASKSFGMQFLPRVGDEVLVSFLGGDPDRPVITGSLYNADNMPPYDPVNQAYASGLKTKSTAKGDGTKNYNELRFEDQMGKELVYFHAERDYTREVENNDTLKVGFDAKDAGDQTIDVYNDRTVTVDQGNDTLQINTGNRTVGIDKGNDALTIKQGNLSIAVKAGSIDIEAAQSITLKVGPSSIKLDTQGVTIAGSKITAQAQLKAAIQGVMVDVNASGVMTLQGGLVKIN